MRKDIEISIRAASSLSDIKEILLSMLDEMVLDETEEAIDDIRSDIIDLDIRMDKVEADILDIENK